jgi:hypothetical protein
MHLHDWSTQPDSQVIVTGWPVTSNIFQNGSLPYMNEDTGKFGYGRMQQRTKKDKN